MIKLIAETAWHHNGDFPFMVKLVEKIIHESKADVIKLHLLLDLDEYMMPDHEAYPLVKEKLFSQDQWSEIIEMVKASGKELMLLLNDSKSIEFGMQFNPSLVEIHSVCLNDVHLLKKLKSELKKETLVVLGVGGSGLYEIENAINILESEKIVLFHGFQNYPTNYQDINFRRIQKIMNLFPEFNHGYADHTAWDEPDNILITGLGAALGMDFVEKHVSTVPGEKRTDWQAAVSIERFNQIADNLKILDKCNGNGNLALNAGERNYSVFGPMKKAAFLCFPLKKGELLLKSHLAFKRTSQIADLSQIEALELIGLPAKSDLEENTLLSKKMFL